MDAVKLEEVSEVEVGAEGVRVTLRNGERKFVGGEVGFELYQKWTEQWTNGVRDEQEGLTKNR
jgi:hypothetical protein